MTWVGGMETEEVKNVGGMMFGKRKNVEKINENKNPSTAHHNYLPAVIMSLQKIYLLKL